MQPKGSEQLELAAVQPKVGDSLEERAARLKAILDAAVDGIISIDERGLIQEVNAATERMFGWCAGELLGQNIKILMPEPYRSEHNGYLERYLRTGEQRIIGIGREVWGQRRDGSTFPLDIAISEVRVGVRRTFTGIVRDITDRRSAEERMLRAERLAAIGQMITGLTHESRNALQRSQACLELLEMEVEDRPAAVDLIRRIQKAQDHLHHLYEEVRDYAAPIRLERRLCNLARSWRDTWSHLEVDRSGRSVSLTEHLELEEPVCRIDPNAMEQVFRNIFENSLSACAASGNIDIEVVSARLNRQEAVRIAVRDTGPGFEPNSLEHVFDPFFTTKTKGTGLGMAIARRIVEAHNGTITAVNAQNQDGTIRGAEIIITLPLE